MQRLLPYAVYFFLGFFFAVALPPAVTAEFYKYVDKDGKTRYVDDIGKIPDAYRREDLLETYKERYDHLSEAQKARIKEEERERDRALKQQEEADEAQRRLAEQKEKLRQQQVTKVTIVGEQVLVPVKIYNDYHVATALMLLDTGASSVVLHQNTAQKLKITPIKKGKARVAGGQMIDAYTGQVERFEVGPFKVKRMVVTVIDHTGGSVNFDGLLGMNFLRQVKHTIDYDKQEIHWHLNQ